VTENVEGATLIDSFVRITEISIEDCRRARSFERRATSCFIWAFWQHAEAAKREPTRLFLPTSQKRHYVPAQGGSKPLKTQIFGRLRQAAFR
jgi:hypothetical protein